MKNVVDEFGREVLVDDENKKLYNYNNAAKENNLFSRNCQRRERTGFWTNYYENGIVDDIEQRLRKWNNAVLLAYSELVKFNATENQDKIFNKNGDFLKDLMINPEDFKVRE